MIRLRQIVEQAEQGQFHDWTRDFDLFKNAINTATETAKSRFEKSLSGRILNKSVIVRASKSQPKQPVKDYTLDRITSVNIVDYFDEWTVVLRDQNNKEYCLVPGFKIKVLGSLLPQEPTSADTPQEPEPANNPNIGQQPTAAQKQPNPKTQPQAGLKAQPPQPLKENNKLPYLDNNYWILTSKQAKDLSIDGKLPRVGYEKQADVSKLKNYVFLSRKTPNTPIDTSSIKSAWIHETPTGGKLVWAIRLS